MAKFPRVLLYKKRDQLHSRLKIVQEISNFVEKRRQKQEVVNQFTSQIVLQIIKTLVNNPPKVENYKIEKNPSFKRTTDFIKTVSNVSDLARELVENGESSNERRHVLPRQQQQQQQQQQQAEVSNFNQEGSSSGGMEAGATRAGETKNLRSRSSRHSDGQGQGICSTPNCKRGPAEPAE